MGGGTRSVGAKIAGTLWLLAFRVILGVATMVDGLSKWGVVHSARPMADLQPSPLGWISPILELMVGACVLVGYRTRIAAGVLAVHLALGLIVYPSALQLTETALDVILLAVVVVFGSTRLSADFYRKTE